MKNSHCQNCGGEMRFKPDVGMIVCERCGSSFPVTETGQKPTRRPYLQTFTIQNEEVESFQCATCGANMLVGSNGEVTRCASCGNLSLKKTVSRHAIPDGIIPFTLTRKKAAEIFRKFVSSRKFAPNDLKTMAKLEKISGLYVPVWNFNFVSTWTYSAIGINKKTDSDGHEYTRN